MINGSGFWKNKLISASKLLKKIEKGHLKITERNLSKVEHTLVTSFLTIRKLLEAEAKVSSSSKSLKCKLYIQKN